MDAVTYQQDAERKRLERKAKLAGMLAQAPQAGSVGGATAMGIAQIIAAFQGKKAQGKLDVMDAQQREADMAAIKANNPAAVRDPRLQQLAMVLAGQNQQREVDFLNMQLGRQDRQEDLARQDQQKIEGRDFQRETLAQTQGFQQQTQSAQQSFQQEMARMQEQARIQRAADDQRFRLQMEQDKRASKPNFTEEQLIKSDVDRVSVLRDSQAGRKAVINNAKAFLSVLSPDPKGGKVVGPKGSQLEGLEFGSDGADSGTGRMLLNYMPGSITDQSKFDEMFDAFAEDAARASLSARGETKTTDADVKGAKDALFGIGKDEKANREILKTFIQQQEQAEAEYQQLLQKYSSKQKPSGLQDMSDDELLKALQ